ncbi:MAG: radical SAM protein [Oligoflexia bacterium]|nr:radical SAM protein [Oligoflexia bacterium]
MQLVEALCNKDDYSNIPGLWVKKSDGSIAKNEMLMLTENLDALPLPDFRNMQSSYVIENEKCRNEEPYYNDSLTHYNFITARGCPFRCDFCSNSIFYPMFKGKGRILRQRSVDNVIKELKNAKQHFKKLSSVSCNDELFGLDFSWLNEFCEKYKKEIGLSFHCDMHPSYVTEEKIAALAKMGLQTISMGIQSGVERTRLEVFGRNTPDSIILNAATLFKKYKVFPSYDLILDNPLENEEDVRKTLYFMLQLPGRFSLNVSVL